MCKFIIKIIVISFLNSFTLQINAQQSLFEMGQSADIIIHPYAAGSNTQGLYGPSRAVSDGTHLFVSDTRNNRVLIWNSIPTMNYQPADVVVGQSDFVSNYSNVGATGLCWPMGVFSDGEHLFISDAGNHRVLIWNHIPTTNGEPADVVLGQQDFETTGDLQYTVGTTASTTR